MVDRHETHPGAQPGAREPLRDPLQVAVRLSRWLAALTMAPSGALALADGIRHGTTTIWLFAMTATMLAAAPVFFAIRRAPLGVQTMLMAGAVTAVAWLGLLHYGPTLAIGTLLTTACVAWTLFFGRAGLIGGVSSTLAFFALVAWAISAEVLHPVYHGPQEAIVWLRNWLAVAGNISFVCLVTHVVWGRYRQLLVAERAARRDAEEAARARDEFLSLASHELRTPLTSLKLLVQAIASGRPADQRVVQNLDRQVRRLERLVGTFVDVTSLDTGRPLDREAFDLAALTCEVVADVELASSAGSELRVRAPEAVTGSWDRALIRQLVAQVVGNAIKFGAGRPIDVVVEGDAREARVVVRDEGPGIAADDRDRVFQRFQRGVPWTHYGGLGLGLPLARKIARMHDGDLLLEGEPGAGSTFTIVLPRAARASAAASAGHAPVGRATAGHA